MSGFSEWLANLDAREKWRFIAAGGVLLLAAWFVFAPQSTPAEPTNPVAFEVSQTDTTAELMLVHVSGEVIRPGLYELPLGARVADAIRLSGGFTDAAQTGSINLARILNDGEQIVVSSADETSNLGEAALININAADAAELDELPGIGPALAARIVQWRSDFGSFQRLEDLLEVSGIGEKLLSQLLPLVTL